MSRVIQARITGVDLPNQRPLQAAFAELVGARQWRGALPWLADRASSSLLAQLFFERASIEWKTASAERLSAAAFVQVARDEADALAVCFILRDLSERFDGDVDLRDPDNPIAKLRHITLRRGRLRGGAALESILVQRSIYRTMPDGSRMEMIPPRVPGSAFGRALDHAPAGWSFVVHDIRVVEPTFLGAEAEAMRIFRGLGSLPPEAS